MQAKMSIFPLPYIYEADKAEFDYWGLMDENDDPYMKR